MDTFFYIIGSIGFVWLFCLTVAILYALARGTADTAAEHLRGLQSKLKRPLSE